MHAGEVVVDPEVGHDDRGKCYGACDGVEVGRFHFGDHTGVDDKGVNHNADQRPGLLGVPAPVAAPGFVGPDGTQHIPDSDHGEADDDGHLVDLGQLRNGVVDVGAFVASQDKEQHRDKA